MTIEAINPQNSNVRTIKQKMYPYLLNAASVGSLAEFAIMKARTMTSKEVRSHSSLAKDVVQTNSLVSNVQNVIQCLEHTIAVNARYGKTLTGSIFITAMLAACAGLEKALVSTSSTARPAMFASA